jgi:hypothetical protein
LRLVTLRARRRQDLETGNEDRGWGIFKGLRGTYGFRTEMWIDDDISQGFAFDIGVGAAANLSAWFHATDNCKWDHST